MTSQSVLGTAAAVPVPASTVAPLGRAHLVGDGVYAFTQPDGSWCLNNAGIITGRDRTVVFDTAATERRTRALLAELDRLATDVPRVLVNSHFHGDHTLGNFLFEPDVPIVAHPEATRLMAETGLGLTALWPDVEWGAVTVRLPDLEVPESLVIGTGSSTVEVRHLGVSHTTNDLIGWLPRERVLFAGDQVMSGCTPFLLFGSVMGSRAALARLAELDPVTVVPGHGAVGGPELIAQNLAYLDWIWQIAAEGVRTGASPLTAARTAGPGPLPGWLDAERHVANLHRAYAELNGLSPGEPLSVEQVFDDLIACCPGGGPRCLA